MRPPSRCVLVLVWSQPGEPRALWASNRVCEAAVRHRKQEQHLANLRNIKPMIDNRDPRKPKSSNSKGARLEEERNNQIMHENTILLNKLSRILTRDSNPVQASILPRGLNETHKRAERERIDRENQALLRRLQDVRPSIDAEAARQQYALHQHLLRSHGNSFVANPFLQTDMNGIIPGGSRSRPQSAIQTGSVDDASATEVMPGGVAGSGGDGVGAVGDGVEDVSQPPPV